MEWKGMGLGVDHKYVTAFNAFCLFPFFFFLFSFTHIISRRFKLGISLCGRLLRTKNNIKTHFNIPLSCYAVRLSFTVLPL